MLRGFLVPINTFTDVNPKPSDWIAKKDDELIVDSSNEPTPFELKPHLEPGMRMIFPEIGASFISPDKLQIDSRDTKRISFLYSSDGKSEFVETYSITIDRVTKEETIDLETFSQKLVCPDGKIIFICNSPSEEIVHMGKTECMQKTYQTCISDLKKATKPISNTFGTGIMFENNPYEQSVFQVIFEINPTELFIFSTSGINAGDDVSEKGKATILEILSSLELVK